MTMSSAEYGQMVRDVQMATTLFPLKQALAMFPLVMPSADYEMYLHDFLPLLLRTAYQRSNPEWNDAIPKPMVHTLPIAMNSLLQGAVVYVL